jgi:hypothetical protein
MKMRVETPGNVPIEELQPAPEPSETGEQSVAITPRPSLDVAIDSHALLLPRITSFCTRLLTWDTRALSPVHALLFSGAIADMEASYAALGAQLATLKAEGFEAKTTQSTRIKMRLKGKPVALRQDARDEFAKLFTDEQLDSLTFTQSTRTKAMLVAGDGSTLGLVPFTHLLPKD